MRTKEHLRQELAVSNATINNWVKTGVVPPYPNGKKYFDELTYQAVLDSIKFDFQKLQKRVNRSQNIDNSLNSGTVTNVDNRETILLLIKKYQSINVSLSSFMYSLSLCYLQSKKLIYINDNVIESTNIDFTNFLLDWQAQTKSDNLTIQFSDIVFPENETDFLGSVYESLRTIGDKSHFGAFFTPTELVNDIKIPSTASVLDPCAGTGSILLGILSKSHDPDKVVLRDIDQLALNIAKVNFAIFFNQIDVLVHTEVRDILFDKTNQNVSDLFAIQPVSEHFDYIITNPPFGAKLSNEVKNKLLRDYPLISTTESFGISLYNCLQKLGEGSLLYFILPESILYVDTHLSIRKYLFEIGKKIKITHFGNAFKGVMSKIIRLDIENTVGDLEILNNGFQWTVPKNILTKNGFRPPHILSKIETNIIDKIFNADTFTLQGKCQFGLGIVTGNNEANLKKDSGEGLEPIFTGKELPKFKFDQAKYYIDFKPEHLQQVAPIELYRQPKICYRFISDSIVTVADLDGCLVLNSINFLIPDKTIPIKALSTFLNSSVVTFIYRRFFNSTKVLKNHIKSIPIPKLIVNHWPVLESLYQDAQNGENISQKLNLLVCELYGLTTAETEYILININWVGDTWAFSQLISVEPDLKRPTKKINPLYRGEYDLYLDWTNPKDETQHHIKIEVKASRATDRLRPDEYLYIKALHSDSDSPFLMNFQQIKPRCADVFLWVAVYRDTIKYWVLSADAVQHSKHFTPQHRNEETALRENDYDKAEIYEGQIMLTNQNANDFAKYITTGKALKSNIIAQYKLQQGLK